VEPHGAERVTAHLTLTNNSSSPVSLTRSPMFILSRGGYAWMTGDPLMTSGTFFGVDKLAAGATSAPIDLLWLGPQPFTHWLFRLDTAQGGGPLLAAVPFVRAGYAPPAPPVVDDVFLGLQEPIEVLPLSTGKKFLTVIWGTVNTTGMAMSFTRWSTKLGDATGTVFDADLTVADRVHDNAAPIITSVYGWAVPDGFTTGTVTVSTDLTLAAGPVRALVRSVPVRAVEPAVRRPPIQGLWRWANGPGQLGLDQPNLFSPARRHAYDLRRVQDVDGAPKTFDGDPALNESYFAFGQPFFAIEGGIVSEVLDDVPDNFGNTLNPANDKQRTSYVVLQHDAGRFTVYTNLRQGSAKVKLGQLVQTGDLLGEVGNAGDSPEPQLRFWQFQIDDTGRPQALPLAFTGLTTVSGGAVTGVPKGGDDYLTGP
jgi:hypothetical protein